MKAGVPSWVLKPFVLTPSYNGAVNYSNILCKCNMSLKTIFSSILGARRARNVPLVAAAVMGAAGPAHQHFHAAESVQTLVAASSVSTSNTLIMAGLHYQLVPVWVL